MAKKKKLTKAERKEARLRKGKQWLLTYTGSPKKMNKHYRERFHVDAVTAAKDLQELGVNYTQEQLDQIKRAEEQRLRQRRMEREAKERERLAELYEDCDGHQPVSGGGSVTQSMNRNFSPVFMPIITSGCASAIPIPAGRKEMWSARLIITVRTCLSRSRISMR